MNVLVTGGAGFVGSHAVRSLTRAGHRVIVIDDLSTGHRDTIPDDVPFVHHRVGDRVEVARTLRDHRVDAVVHFAARIEVGESVRDPRRYYVNNLSETIALLEETLDAGVTKFVLSSTAAVYGNPERVPISEDHATQPVNPYGETKLTIEKMLGDYGRAYGLGWAALRYFNAAGADADAGLAERHNPESHLIPKILDVARGLSLSIGIYGTDHPTKDGTCIRDYVHVCDLSDAHVLALHYLQKGGASGPMNLGTGEGHSVREVIAMARHVTGHAIPEVMGPRREGDPAALVASPARAMSALGWKPGRSSLEGIVRDAWRARTAKT